MNVYNTLETKYEFFITYNFHISKAIKRKMPDALMTAEMWKRTSNKGGSNEFYKDEKALVFEWYPTVTVTLGDNVEEYKMKVVDEKEMNYVECYGEDIAGKIHKPFSDLMFITKDKIWNFYNEKYFKLPLTQKTFEFFSSFEESFIKMISSVLAFLGDDEETVLKNISKAIETGQFKNLLQ